MSGSLLEHYKKLFRNLLPKGRAWDDIKEDPIGLIEAIVTEFCRFDERSRELLKEFDPGTSTELLEDWETLLGLPDECSELANSIDERRLQARQKLAALGGIDAQYYQDLALQLGFDSVVVTDFHSFRVGRSRVGDPLSNPFDSDRDVFRVGRNRVGDTLVRHGWRYTFNVKIPAEYVEPFRVGSNRVGDPLVNFGNDLLECTFKKLKPAHTSVFFTFF